MDACFQKHRTLANLPRAHFATSSTAKEGGARPIYYCFFIFLFLQVLRARHADALEKKKNKETIV